MRAPIWIDLLDALAYHAEALAAHGGAECIRDSSALESALARPRNLLAYSERNPSLFALAASYAFGLARSHPFVDGNKRTAFLVSFVFLSVNGIEIIAPAEDRYLTFLGLAEGSVSEKELARWFEKNSRKSAQ